MRYFKLASSLVLLALGACGERPQSAGSKPPERYAVPSDAGCIGNEGRPAAPPPLKQRYTAEQWAAWKSMPGVKAKAVEAQAYARLNYEDEAAAATAACH